MGEEPAVGRVKQGTAALCYKFYLVLKTMYTCNFDKNEKIHKLNKEQQSEERKQSLCEEEQIGYMGNRCVHTLREQGWKANGNLVGRFPKWEETLQAVPYQLSPEALRLDLSKAPRVRLGEAG